MPLAASILTAIVTLAGQFQFQKWKEREKLHLLIEWETWENEDRDYESHPFVSVHNKSGSSIYITDIRYLVGWFFRNRVKESALYFGEWGDAESPLPSLIEADSVQKFQLDSSNACKLVPFVGSFDRIWHSLNRFRLQVEIQTLANTKVRIGALRVLPPRMLPNWFF